MVSSSKREKGIHKALIAAKNPRGCFYGEGFLSPNVANVLVEKFNIKPIGTVEEDIAAMMAGNFGKPT